jgi:signal transduction histidine kinase
MNNISHHSGARNARVELRCPEGAVEVMVEDDGHGFEVAEVLSATSPSQAVGLLGMQERVSLLAGTLNIHFGAEQGTQIHIRIAWEVAREGGHSG